MWYLRGWWEVDLGSRLVADWRQYLRRCSPDESGRRLAEKRHSREGKESKDPRRTMETMQGDRLRVQKNEMKILCDGACAVPDGGSVQIQESLYVEVEGLEGKRRERHSKSL